MAGNVPLGCGQCLPCRVNRRRQWTSRQYLESLCHEENCFVTLTYDDHHIPPGGSLVARDLQLWIKSIRFRLGERRIRYFAVGEYGGKSARPHFHLSLFGVSGGSVVEEPRPKLFEQVALESWGRGFVQVAEFNANTAQYVCGYVTKKMTSAGDPRLGGRAPEFARMSNRPGIGALAVGTLARSLGSSFGAALALDELGDVPRQVRLGKRKMQLGRYLVGKLREAVGFTPEFIKEVKQKVALDASVELSALFASRVQAAEASEVVTYRKVYLEQMGQRILQVEKRAAIYSKKETL